MVKKIKIIPVPSQHFNINNKNLYLAKVYLKYIVHMHVKKAEMYCHVAYDITSTIKTVMVEHENKIENRIVSIICLKHLIR